MAPVQSEDFPDKKREIPSESISLRPQKLGNLTTLHNTDTFNEASEGSSFVNEESPTIQQWDGVKPSRDSVQQGMIMF